MRRLRGVASTALLWGTAWAIGFSPVLILAWRNAQLEGFPRPLSALAVSLLLVGGWGALSGCAFAGLLWAAERKSGWTKLRTGRVVVWGLLAGFLPATIFGVLVQGIRWPSLGILLIAGMSALIAAALALLNVRFAHRPPSM